MKLKNCFYSLIIVLLASFSCHSAEASKLVVGTGNLGGVRSVALSPDDPFLLFGGKKKIKLWEVATGKLVRSFGGLFESQNYVITLQFSPNGKITIKEIEAYISDRVPELTQQFRGSAQ